MGARNPDLAREWPALVAVLVLLCAVLSCTKALQRADLAFLDIASHTVHRVAAKPVVVIAIDDHTIDVMGRLPFAPTTHATLIDQLTDSGAAAVAFAPWNRAIGSFPPERLMPLVAAIRRNGKVVIPPSVLRRTEASLAAHSQSSADFARARFEAVQDFDGLYRSVFMLSGEGRYDELVATQLLRASGASPAPCSVGEVRRVATEGAGCRRYVPLGAKPSFERISYVDALRANVPPDFFRGRIVLIGVTAYGYDTRLATPLVGGESLNNIEFLAEATNALETSTLIRPASTWVQMLFSVSVVPIVCLALYLLSPRAGLVASVGIALAMVLAAYLCLVCGHVLVPPGVALTTALAASPLWAWRRQEALLAYLAREAQRSLRDPAMRADAASRPTMADPVQHRLDVMTSLVGRVNRYRDLVAQWVDSLPEATFVADREGVILLANAQVTALASPSGTQATMPSPVGRIVADVLFDITASHRAVEFAGQALALLAHSVDDGAAFARAEVARSQGIEVTSGLDGRALLIKCALIRDEDGSRRALIFHVADVSSIRRAERQRDMALRFMSHDMRSPQAAVLALVEQMREAAPRLTVRHFIELVEHYARTALSLSDDFLFLARAECVGPTLVWVDPALVLGDVVDDFWPQASAKSIAVELIAEPGCSVIADVQMLRRAYGNLLSNAIRHSARGATITIRLTETARYLFASFVDEGEGISALDRRRLFREFAQFGNCVAQSGHGLGLALVKSVVETIGGQVFVRSSLGKGSVFTVRLLKSVAADDESAMEWNPR